MSLCWVCGEKGKFKCGSCNIGVYCSETCQKKDWERHQIECSVFAQVKNWIDEDVGRIWRGTKEIKKPIYLLLNRSLQGSILTKGITLQKIVVPEKYRKKGIATKVLEMLETIVKEKGLSYVLIESIESDIMLALAKKRGYKQMEFDEFSYIKFI